MRRKTVNTARRFLLLVILAAIAAGVVSAWQMAREGAGPTFLPKLFGPLFPLAGQQIGIVAGHHGNDSGAVCPDGLTEAQVNLTIAQAVARELRSRGATVDLLAEFDSRLPGYRAAAFISIHADSCQVNLSGYKVARLDTGELVSSLASARLADCLWQEYEVATGLPRHPNTVTFDMSRYHAFREIAPTTPAAIIEAGFLKADRVLLTQQPERAAAGIVSGITCFLTKHEGGAP
jgi:N-acetylmuramoyl-L-alanine amidase